MTVLWTMPDLADALDELPRSGGPGYHSPMEATGVSIDTRTLQPGDIFVALRGENRDGAAFIADAWARGAAAVIAEASDDENVITVSDTATALAWMGDHARFRFAGRVVAVTGSVGKTTTKEMLRAILALRGPTHAAEASHNNHWGVPLTLARLPPDAGFCIVEIGMNHAGEIYPLARLASPHVAVVTSVEAVHIGHLGSIEAIADEKAMIFRGMRPGGTAVIPADSQHVARLRVAAETARATVVTFGAAGDARLENVELTAEATGITADIGGRTVRFRIGLPGRHMAMNALAALAAAMALGVPPEAAAHALEGFAPLPGRGARRPIEAASGKALLIDESYNASPASIRAALSVLGMHPPRRVAVLGDMLELGESAVAAHEDLAGDVAANADLLFACGPSMRALFDAAPAHLRGAHAPDSDALAPMVAGAVAAGDVVLVKGSLGSAMRRVVAALEKR